MRTWKALYLLSAFLFFFAALAITAYAGEGSDTIGACRLMPELRYSYYQTDLTLDRYPYDYLITRQSDWKSKEHDATVNLTWGATDNIDLYTFVGAKIAAETVGTGFGPDSGEKRVLDTGTAFMCGVGLKGTFWRSQRGFYMGGGLSFTYSITDDKKHLRFYSGSSLLSDSAWFNEYFRETGLSGKADLHAGWHIGDTGLTPYIGVEYHWIKNDIEWINSPIGYVHYVYHAENPVGPYVGLDYLVNDRLYLNLEGHMVNRWGGSFAIGYKFDICGRPEPVPPPPAPAPVIEPKIEPMSKN